jgi:peptidoglycan/LPS O-acetylase OafA/YrhL
VTDGAPTASTVARAVAVGDYHPALDGLRAVAVIAVVLYHAGATSDLSGVAPGGFIGVSVFFTLSGYLVTTLLLRQIAGGGGLDLGRFWTRRLKRLAPASLVVVLATVLLSSRFWTGMTTSDALAGTFGYTNWHVIWSGEDALLRTIVGPLGPFWSLAIEEQFYLLLVVVVITAVRTARPIRTLTILIACGWSASVVVQLLADWPQYQLEFSTITRASELLAGSALAVLLHTRPELQARLSSLLRPVGIVAMGLIVILAATTDYDPPWLLHGGYGALSLVNTALVMSLLAPGPLTRVLEWAPAVTIGRLSYSWYLVHWPIILILTPDRTGLESWALLALKVAASLAVAVILHRVVEQPLRRLEVPQRSVVVTWAASSLVVTVAAIALL